MKNVTPERYLEMSKDDAKRALDQAMERFDFDKAAAALVGCGWGWAIDGLPSLDADGLRVMARKLLMQAIQSGSGTRIAQGPLEARTFSYDSPSVVTVELHLVPVSGSSVYIDCRAYLVQRIQKAAKGTAAKKTVEFAKPKGKGVSQ